MAKNFKTQFERTGDSIAVNQSWFIVEETTKGVFAAPTDADFIFGRSGGAIEHSQPFEISEHRSGRHNNEIVLQKKETSWSLPTYINIDTSLGSPGAAEIDPAVRVLWKSMLGTETIPGGLVYTAANDPDITFSLYENMDKYANQTRASFVMSSSVSIPGDGTAMVDWSGNGADRLRVGISIFTTDSNTTNIITLDTAAEAKKFPVGAQVMIIEDDGVTRSADTPNGSYRTVTAADTGTGAITLSGAVLADADGTTGTGFYLAYAEPAAPTAISDIQTGLVGSMSVDLLGGVQDCARNINVNMENNHELVNYCAFTDTLGSPYFVPGARLNVGVEVDFNMNESTILWLYDLDQFTANDLDIIVGDATGRHMKIDLPKVIFEVPSPATPDEGSIPFTSSGTALQTALDAADEVTVSFL